MEHQNIISEQIQRCKGFFSESWHLFTNTLAQWVLLKKLKTYSSPQFDEEVIVPLKEIEDHFLPALILSAQDISSKETLKTWAELIESAPIAFILSLAGQRFTSASIKDWSALPPSKKVLLASCFEPFNEHISVATRAWEKHAHRHPDKYWGVVKGTPSQKEAEVRKIVNHIIHNATWWNTFYHYTHEVVFEVRVSSGHGIRWARTNMEFIGFLEPFINANEEDRHGI